MSYRESMETEAIKKISRTLEGIRTILEKVLTDPEDDTLSANYFVHCDYCRVKYKVSGTVPNSCPNCGRTCDATREYRG